MNRPIKTILIIACVVLHTCFVKSTDAAPDTAKQPSVPGNALAKQFNPYPATVLP